MSGNNYLKKVEDFLKPYLDKEGYVLIKTEFTEENHVRYLRAYIDLKESGSTVSINDCVKVSRRLGQWLDKEDFIKEEYTLEVCSPGFLKPADEEGMEEENSETEADE